LEPLAFDGAVHPLIFPEPEAGIPIEVLLLVQLIAAPDGVVVKV